MTKSSIKPLYPASSDLLSGSEPCGAFPLDPCIAGMVSAAEMLGAPAPQRFVDMRLAVAAAAIFVALFAASARAYAADPEQVNEVKRLAIAEGVVMPPKRPSADDRARAEAQRWGFENGKAVGA